ncbi:MAG: hypothetical protein PVG66_00565 [Chromatiales bacterium]|jgi:hypothetical protein
MELKLDAEKYDEFQEIFIAEIIETIMVKLVESGLEGIKLEETTANLAFSIASILDDTTEIESDGVQVKPYLTFRASEDEIVHCGENSYTYEFVIGVLKKLFEA